MRDPLARFESACQDIGVLLRAAKSANEKATEEIKEAIQRMKAVMAKMPLDVDMDGDESTELFGAVEDFISDVQKALGLAENKIDGAVEALNGIRSVV